MAALYPIRANAIQIFYEIDYVDIDRTVMLPDSILSHGSMTFSLTQCIQLRNAHALNACIHKHQTRNYSDSTGSVYLISRKNEQPKAAVITSIGRIGQKQ